MNLPLIVFGLWVAMVGWLIVSSLREKQRLTRLFGRLPCDSCGKSLGEIAAAARKRMPITGPANWWVKCTVCGEESIVNHWKVSQWEAKSTRAEPKVPPDCGGITS